MVPLLTYGRIFEDDLHTVVDARTESLQTLRELGPPDLAQLVKIPIKGAQKQVWSARSSMPSLGANSSTARCLPSCYRRRRLILRQPRRVHQHPDLCALRQSEQGRFWPLLVCPAR
jgi:hypothetical protein